MTQIIVCLNLHQFLEGIIVIVFAILIIGIFYHFRDRRTYELDLPQINKLEKVLLKENETEISISDTQEINNFLDSINGTKRITKEESIQDYPINVDNIIQVDFILKDKDISTIFVYIKKDKYYIEQPYNGIYQINEEEYNLIEKVIK